MEKEALTVQVKTVLTERDYERLKKFCEGKGVKISRFVRELILKELESSKC